MDVKTQTENRGDTAVPVHPHRDNREIDHLRNPGESESADEGGTLIGQVRFVLSLVLIVLVIRTFLVSPFSIPSESMLPRLWNGDYLLAAKWPYGYSRHSMPFDVFSFEGRLFPSAPEAGDVVIFKHPVDQTDYIKRVIGLPGDEIAILGGQIMLNGELVDRELVEDFGIAVSPNTPCGLGKLAQIDNAVSVVGGQTCTYRQYRETLPSGRQYDVLDLGLAPGDSMAQITVPQGHMFVMGDNRDNSRDSRFPARAGDAVGLVPLENLVGRAQVIVWSTDGSAQWAEPWTWFSAARWDRIGNGL